MTLAKTMYETIFRRTSTTAVFVLASCFVFERLYNPISDNYFYNRNEGVSGCILAVPWLYLGCTLAVPWLYLGCTLAVSWLCHGCVLVV